MREKPWLIQRMEFKKEVPPSPGIDQLLSMDYMGSAEFEYGALPKSLKEMTKVADKLEVFGVKDIKAFDGKMLTLICTKEMFEVYKKFMPELVDESMRLKEHTRVKARMTNQRYSFRPEPLTERELNMAWWDIDFHVMFCFGKEEARKIVKSIKVVRDRKKEEKAEGWY